METKHTPGPWYVENQDIFGNEEGGYICTWSGRSANAQRIVDCVNACEGINPKAVSDLLAALTALHDAHFELHPDQYLGELGQTIRRIIDKATK